MKAEIISIGDELLIGQVVNTNASWIGQQLAQTGIRLHQVSVISDQREHILTALREAEARAGIILITGGLGPTRDDITKEALCNYFDTGLTFDEASFRNIEKLFYARGVPVSELNRKQAEIPGNCRPIANLHGTAPGMWFEKEGKIFVSMPGVPFEMKAMMENDILPRLQARFSATVRVHKTVLTQGVGESFLAAKIAGWEDRLPPNIKLAYLPQPGIVRLRLSATGTDREQLTGQVAEQVGLLREIIPELIFGYDEDTLESVTGRLLLQAGKTVVTAESCTGGYIAHRITTVPGSSRYFKGSVVSYSNELKSKLLGVPWDLILQHGAVSEAVVSAMAGRARSLMQADYAIAVSGIAGPEGGTEEKPVGTVWIAIASGSGITARKFQFGDHRERNIIRSTNTALNLLRILLENT